MNEFSEIFWISAILKIGVLLFLAFIVLLVFRVIRTQQLRNMESELKFHSTGIQLTTNFMPIGFALLAGVAAFWVAFSGGPVVTVENSTHTLSEDSSSKVQERIVAVETRLKSLIEASNAIDVKIDNSDSNQLKAIIIEIKSSTSENATAIKSFEELLLSDAEKLLTLPLLKREIASFKSEITLLHKEVNTVRALLAESNNQNRWLIGTLALGMLALVLPAIKSVMSSNVPQEKEKQEKKDS